MQQMLRAVNRMPMTRYMAMFNFSGNTIWPHPERGRIPFDLSSRSLYLFCHIVTAEPNLLLKIASNKPNARQNNCSILIPMIPPLILVA